MKLKRPTFAIVLAGVAAGLFFSGYFLAIYQKPGYQEGFDSAFSSGYNKGATDLFLYNTQPDSWITLDKKVGVAALNGTDLAFAWKEQNVTKTISLKSATQLERKQLQGTLYLMSDPIKIPPTMANSGSTLQPKMHFIFQDQQNNKYFLERP